MEKDKLEIAEIRMKLIAERLKRRFPILTYPISLLKFKAIEYPIKEKIATNGEYVFFWSGSIDDDIHINGYKTLEKDLLHIVLHGLLGHFFIYNKYKNRKLISVAMDREVEHIVEELYGKKDYNIKSIANENMSAYLGECFNISCYYKGIKKKAICKKMLEYGKKLKSDDHEYWLTPEIKQLIGQNVELSENSEIEEKWQNAAKTILPEATCDLPDKISDLVRKMSNNNRKWGKESDDISVEVKASEDEGNSYYDIIVKFFKDKESIYEDPDSIDYMFYNYGLELYGDTPLIEPTEENEVLNIDTICIAIDTSGSCSGKVAQDFLSETSAILEELKNNKVETDVYIWECDQKIQKEEHYENISSVNLVEFEKRRMRGWGGTSFIPVFDKIKTITKEKKVECLIYLTDGYGDYPDEIPDYPVYFVGPYEDDCDVIPKWITQLKLRRKEKNYGFV